MQMYNHDGALKYCSLVLKIDAKNPEALAMFKQLNTVKNNGEN
jgi:hypothetical protein